MDHPGSGSDEQAAGPLKALKDKIERLEQKLEESRASQALLREITLDIAASHDSTDEIIRLALEHVARRYPKLRVAFSVIGEDGIRRVRYSVEPPGSPDLTGVSDRLRAAPNYLRRLGQGEIVSVADVKTEQWLAGISESFAARGTRAFLDVPMVRTDELINIISLDSAEVTEWRRNEEELLSQVAEYLGFVLKGAKVEAERLRAQRDLQRSEQQLRLITDSLPVLIAYVDSNENFQFSNKAHQQWWGLSKDQIVGRSMREVLGEEIYKATLTEIRGALSGEHLVFERTIHYRGGGTHYVEVTYLPHLDDRGGVKGFFVLVNDLTEKKAAEEERRRIDVDREKAEEALRQSEQRFRRLVEKTRVVPWEADIRTWNFTYIGPQAVELLGFPLAAWYENNFWVERVHPDDREGAIRFCRERNDIGDDYEIEYRLIGADGETVWVRDIVSISADSEGALTLQGFLIDITASKKAEHDKLALEEQLRQSQRLEALGTLAGGIAHDFNNILGGILGYTDLALGELSDRSSAGQYLKRVHTSAHRAKDLIKQILTFSQRNNAERKPVNLCVLMDEVLTLMQATIPSTIKIEKAFFTDSVRVLANPTQIHQVLLNICTNAEHAMRSSGGVLSVEVRLSRVERDSRKPRGELKPGAYAVISIKDSGYGMSEEVASRIFEPYFTTKAVGEGSGLGLSVAHGIVASHGGLIEVTSELGTGAQFDVYLPVVAAVEVVHEDDQAAPRRGKGRVLFVDDEKMLADLGRDMLRSLGYEVTSCTHSPEALDLLRRQPDAYDLLITDQTMPELSGDMLVSSLRQLGINIPIVLCTGYSARVDELSARRLAISHFLMKPYTIKELGDIVGRVLESSQKVSLAPARAKAGAIDIVNATEDKS